MHRIEVVGLTPAQIEKTQRRLESGQPDKAIRVRVQGNESKPSILGKLEIDKNKVVFLPRFPFRPNIVYQIVIDAEILSKARNSEFSFKWIKEFRSDTVVQAIYPSADKLPENLLRFYIYFSSPMSRGDSYSHIKLVRIDTNQVVELPFLELAEELWNDEGTRLTLLLDPGRVKKELLPRKLAGPVLEPKVSYCLTIESTWLDSNSQKLKKSFKKEFSVTDADVQQPNPTKWKIKSPHSAVDSLEIEFDQPIDYAMARNAILVKDDHGKLVDGTIDVSQQETLWTFQNSEPWRRREFHLDIDSQLEDPSGNSVAKPFEVNLKKQLPGVSPKRIRLPFSVQLDGNKKR